MINSFVTFNISDFRFFLNKIMYNFNISHVLIFISHNMKTIIGLSARI